MKRHQPVIRHGWHRLATVLTAVIAMAGVLTAVSPNQAWASGDDPAYKSLKKANNPDWMKDLGDDTPLGWLSVPGTHESMSIRGGDSTYTQEDFGASAKTLAAQLQAGIRAIDIRVRVIGGGFTIHHGVVYQEANFADALKVLGDFLSSHPSETVLMHLRAECDNSSSAITDCNDKPKSTSSEDRVNVFRKYLADDPNGKYFWGPSVSGNGQADVPNLGEVRGKVVLERFRSVGDFSGKYGLTGGSYFIQDDYTVPSVLDGDIIEKVEKVRGQLDAADKDTDPKHIYLNYTSGSSALAYPKAVADRVNAKVLSPLGATRNRTGEVLMDYPGYGMINTIIAANRPWKDPAQKTVFEDDFNGPAGAGPDSKNWGYETGGNGWGNKERQYYTDSTDNARLDGDGNLVIEARKDNTGGLNCHYGPCEVTSARLVGAGKVSAKYGRIEVKIKVPGAKGAWPAFWMLGDTMPQAGWPGAGEIDIMENIGNQPNRLMGTVHGPGYSASGGIGGELMNDQPLGDAFHTYRVDWGPDRLTWFFDGKAYLSVGREDLRGYPWVFDHPFYPILNLAVGGDLGGSVDLGDFPAQMAVDYVKITDLGGANPQRSNPPTTGKGWRTWRPEAPAVAIRSTADNTVLDVQYGSHDKGAKVVTWDYTDADNQRWQMLRHAWDNDFMYRNIGSQLVLDKDGGGTGVLQWEFTDANNQDWVFADAPGGAKGEVQIKNGANSGCLTNKGRGSQVTTEACRGGDRSQVWMLDDVHRGGDLGKPVWQDWNMESKSLNIENAATGEVLDVPGGSTEAGAQVVTWGANGGGNQTWKMYRRTTENRFMFTNLNSFLVLDKNRSGNQVAQYDFGGNANQEWIFEDADTGTVSIHNGMGNGCLTNAGHGSQVQVQPCTSGDRNQMWRLREVP
ncbi:phosphatidylinositol-specific phospholipase C domain-containing protein [Kitasatospora sp. NPDC058243]|uniref:phosphatidylinositol-specific phospholipase C domain-containing protein n=1 Tax=Kitasatospora sp. NPDC058243 TaxID=3346397 RepID=UPI0036D82C30